MIHLKLFEEFVEKFDNDLIDAKMTELRELVDSFSEGHNLIYEWENKDDHQVLINFTMDDNSIRYEFDVDDMFISKILNDEVVFNENVESIDEALDIIEKDIQNVLGVSESGRYSSSIGYSDELHSIVKDIKKITDLDISDNSSDIEGLIDEMERKLSVYDDFIIEDVIDLILFSHPSSIGGLRDDIINLGDKIMDRSGTEPSQILFAFRDGINVIEKYYSIQESKKKPGRPKASKTKSGRKVPGKYLTKNKKSMKKEIDQYQGSSQYKTEWDADYKSGKGGSGKRYKTKKSAATKAYQKKYGKKNESFEKV